MHPRGRLIALEGIDGCGKSTQARILAERTGAALTREPGATPLGKALRDHLLGAPPGAFGARAEALLLAADRAEHVVAVIEPALSSGRWVVSDRFSGSTFAYQGYGRGLDLAALGRIVEFAASGIEADLNVLIDIPVELARARLAGTRPDRFESMDEAFHRKVADGYLHLARTQPGTWVVVAGTDPPDVVARRVLAAVAERLGSPPGLLSEDGHDGQ